MELVPDANILVAGFLKTATTRELLLDERLRFWAPKYVLTETEKVLTAPRLKRKLGGLSQTDVRVLLRFLTSRIQMLPLASYRRELPRAEKIAPHPEDAPYLALALHLDLPLWSNDAALKDQPLVRVYTTPELLALLRNI